MQIEVLKSKIHKATVTSCDLNYIGSITIDESLIKASNLIIGEKVQIVNINNGERLETYVIKGKKIVEKLHLMALLLERFKKVIK